MGHRRDRDAGMGCQALDVNGDPGIDVSKFIVALQLKALVERLMLVEPNFRGPVPCLGAGDCVSLEPIAISYISPTVTIIVLNRAGQITGRVSIGV